MNQIVNLCKSSFKFHRLKDTFCSTSIAINKDECLDYFKKMNIMRNMEISCDKEYKAKNIRGFCHLYDGQEAVAMGTQAVLSDQDNWITSYRCHCIAYLRGISVKQVFAELLGLNDGATGARGGSMHFYNKDKNFYGGQGIVGAQVPVGTGLGFADWYNSEDNKNMPVSIVAYGDGAANQGQIFESMNMAALWKLPVIYCVENNEYGMGTSIERSSFNTEYYTMGNKIPGIQVDGMNLLAIKETMGKAKEHVSNGSGPLVVEFKTYRYHGHSMSDPGITYRDRQEITEVRQTRDPINMLKNIMIEEDLATEDELKTLEKEAKKYVKQELASAKESSLPDDNSLFTKIYSKGDKFTVKNISNYVSGS